MITDTEADVFELETAFNASRHSHTACYIIKCVVANTQQSAPTVTSGANTVITITFSCTSGQMPNKSLVLSINIMIICKSLVLVVFCFYYQCHTFNSFSIMK